MPSNSSPGPDRPSAASPQVSRTSAPEAPAPVVDPAGQSPDAPIEFTANTDVARGNAERANAEPEPAALHSADVPGVPDVAEQRRHESAERDDH